MKLSIPLVTRGQVVVNVLVTLAKMSFTLTGEGFARNGQIAQADGSWLRLSQRIAQNQGKTSGGKRTKKNKIKKAQEESIHAFLGRVSMHFKEKEDTAVVDLTDNTEDGSGDIEAASVSAAPSSSVQQRYVV